MDNFFNMYEWAIKIRNIISHFLYKDVVKPILFLIDPELVHNGVTAFCSTLGKCRTARLFTKFLFFYKNKSLEQRICGINFLNPVGLSAGFDYEANLAQITPSLGFGFHTAGTVTRLQYAGNPRPRLGRLPKSRSLLVNKGFKSSGAENVASRLAGLPFHIPVGISVGSTNSSNAVQNIEQSIDDIVSSFRLWQESDVGHSYYELNISCPNLYGDVSFYQLENLKKLLSALSEVEINRPVFIKMPINEPDEEVFGMLKTASEFKFVTGVIFGNLQKDRSDPSFDKREVESAGKGNFSGKPTYERSNRLISFAYKNFGRRFVIIGCGGIFSAKDAYEKIKAGASLVQMITGMIFEGPQLIGQINQGLANLLGKDGFKNISEAVGAGSAQNKAIG